VSRYNSRTTAADQRHNNTARIAYTVQHNNIVAEQSCAFCTWRFRHTVGAYMNRTTTSTTLRHASFVIRPPWTGRTVAGRVGRADRERKCGRGGQRERESGCGKIRRRRREGRWVKKKHLSAHSYNNNNSNIIM